MKLFKLRWLQMSLVGIIFFTGDLHMLFAAGNQQVQLIPSKSTPSVSESLYVTVRYSVSDNDNTLTGIGLRLYYDSAKLTFNNFSNVFGSPLAIDTSPQDDNANGDNDPTTSKYIGIAWADFGGNWPNQPLPLDLAYLNFTVNSDSTIGVTPVNVTYTSKASGYGFTPTNSSVEVSVRPSISGRVSVNFAGYSDLGVRNAVVSLQGTNYSVSTDSNGDFTLLNIPLGNYVLVVTAPFMTTQAQNVSLTGGNLSVTISPMTILWGDANGDNRIGLEDAIYVLQILTRMRQ